MKQALFPKIVTVFHSPVDNEKESYYETAIKDCLFKILPDDFLNQQPHPYVENLKFRFQSLLPTIKTIHSKHNKDHFSFFMLGKYRANAFIFFFEMFSRWLIPGKRLDVLLLYAADFKIPDFGEEIYTLCELMIEIKDPKELTELLGNLPIIETETKLGLESSYHAQRILEIKGLTADEKTAKIQEYVAELARKAPKLFNRDLFTEMQHVLVICHEQFKIERNSKLLSKIIASHYLFRKDLREAIVPNPDRRHLRVRVFRSKIFKAGVTHSVLSVLVGVNFLKNKEIFEEQHLLTAIQKYIPNVKTIKDSFFANRRGLEHICTVYLEVEKETGEEFSSKEILSLKNELAFDLKDRIGHLTHPIFMPRNEEEIMRNVLALSNQIKYIRDLPQVFISFDEQTDSILFFNVIIVRVVIPGSLSIQEMFEVKSRSLEYIPDRCKMLGMLRKQYTKEATIFRVKIPSQQFLRLDHSIDLYKARKLVVDQLQDIIGDFRDYNGGMISKQSELLCKIQELLSLEFIKYNELLLENFFYSIHPVIMRSILDARVLKELFLMMIKMINKGFLNNYLLEIKKDSHFVFVILATQDELLKKEIVKSIRKMPKESTSLANFQLIIYEIPYIGYIYKTDDPIHQEQFCKVIYQTIEECQIVYH